MKPNRLRSWHFGAALAALFAGYLSAAEPLNISYQTKAAGIVSLGIYDHQGHLVRTLQSGKKLEAGEHQIAWDGNDDERHPAPPGKYELRGLRSNIQLQAVLVAGNPGDPAYATPDGLGGWNGHWGNPMGMSNDGKFLYAQFSQEEVWGSQLKLTEEGKVQWKANLYQGDGNGIQLASATDGKYVYSAADAPLKGAVNDSKRHAVVWRTRVDNGEYALWNQHGLLVGKPYTSGSRPFWELANGDRSTPPTAFGLDGGVSPRGLAVRDNRLYVSLYREDKIEIWDTEQGKLTGEISKIIKPQGLAIDSSGILFVASGSQILRIASDGSIQPAVSHGLVAPWGVALDAVGNLYVTDMGSSQQVKKFTADGKLIWTSGIAGGRPFGGKYQPESFLFPVGISVMPSGRIFVGEDGAPRRIVVLDAAGKLVKDWVGTLDIGAGCGIGPDPADPSIVYVNQALFRYCGYSNNTFRLKLNYAERTWSVDAYWMGLGATHPSREGMGIPDNHQIAFGNTDYQVRHFRGHTFLFSGQHWNHPIWEMTETGMRPCAAIGQGDRLLPVDLDKGYEFDSRGQVRLRGSNRPFIWRDLNGDGMASANEVEFFSEPKGLGGHGSWGAFIDKEMSVYLPDSVGSGNVYKLPCQGLDDKGNPKYSWAKAQIVVAAKDAVLAHADYGAMGDVKRAGETYFKPLERLAVDDAGNIFGTTEIMGHDKGIGWAAETLEVKIGKWDSSGHRVWRAGVKARGFSKPGEFYTGKGVDGILRGFAFFTDENGQSRIYSDDGLYAGSVPSKDPSRGAAPGPDTLSIEYCGGRVATDPKTDADYFYAGDGAGLHVWRINGLKQVERVAVPVQLNP